MYERLRSDAATAGFIDEIERLKSSVAAAPLEVPAGCAAPAAVDAGAPASPGSSEAAIEGIYRWELTAADASAAGIREEPAYPWPWVCTMTLANGTWSLVVQDGAQTNPGEGGRYTVEGDELTLIWGEAGQPMSFRLEQLADGDLRLNASADVLEQDRFVMTTRDWVRD